MLCEFTCSNKESVGDCAETAATWAEDVRVWARSHPCWLVRVCPVSVGGRPFGSSSDRWGALLGVPFEFGASITLRLYRSGAGCGSNMFPRHHEMPHSKRGGQGDLSQGPALFGCPSLFEAILSVARRVARPTRRLKAPTSPITRTAPNHQSLFGLRPLWTLQCSLVLCGYNKRGERLHPLPPESRAPPPPTTSAITSTSTIPVRRNSIFGITVLFHLRSPQPTHPHENKCVDRQS